MNVDEAGWQVQADVAWSGEVPRYVALAMSRGATQPVALEGPAAIVWAALSEGAGAEGAVVSRVAELAGVEADVVRGDVVAFLAELEGLGLAKRV